MSNRFWILFWIATGILVAFLPLFIILLEGVFQLFPESFYESGAAAGIAFSVILTFPMGSAIAVIGAISASVGGWRSKNLKWWGISLIVISLIFFFLYGRGLPPILSMLGLSNSESITLAVLVEFVKSIPFIGVLSGIIILIASSIMGIVKFFSRKAEVPHP